MDMYQKTIIFSCLLFLALISLVAFPLKYTKRIFAWIAVVSAVCALLMYGYGYGVMNGTYMGEDSMMLSILRTVFASCKIFGGSSSWSDIKDAAIFARNPVLWETLSLLLHLMAMITSVSAVVISLGSRLLKQIRIWIFRMRDITLIFGLNENTLEFGKMLLEDGKTALIYIDQTEQAGLQNTVEQMGALFRCDSEALEGSAAFLRGLGLGKGKRKLRVFALDRSMVANHQFARNLMEALEVREVSPERTSLTILSAGEETDNPMQTAPGRYGYGSLTVLDEPEMVARMLIRSYPPYQSLAFDENGRAVKDFHGVIIGFGRTGQAVLRHLVMNSQFQGSNSRIAIFAPDYEKRMGWISHECREMLKHYNIALYPFDGRSSQLYDYLEESWESVNYVAVCAGSEQMNLEISERIQLFLQRRGNTAPILMCSSRGVSRSTGGDRIIYHKIYVPEILCSDEIDKMAMVLNQSYQRTGDMVENWKKCSYFDRMSSRAAADFYDALLYCASVTREEAMENWDPQGQLLENLAASEHLRWNAFHYSMGFRPMTQEEFRERCDNYEAARKENPGYRITKDVQKRIHACMIPWEQLDDYSAKENAVTGNSADYAENDRNNVRALGKLLRTLKSES